MKQILFAPLAVLLTFWLMINSATAEKRVALVIGNSNYKLISPLANPKNDATLMRDTLQSVGFEVITAIDADRTNMSRAIKKFGKSLRKAGDDAVGLFYYAGHGIQASGTNFLVPLGAEIEDQSDLSLETVSASDILAQMESAGNALNLVILDACRNNPFKGKVRSGSRGLARLNAASGSLVAFAAAPGQVAADGSGSNSPYTKALVQAMKQPGLAIEQVFKQTRRGVEEATGGQQTPWEESSLKGDFSFVPAKLAGVSAPQPQPKTEAVPGNSALEVAYWTSIQSSQDAAVFKAYLKRFPNGTFSELAVIKINTLEPKIATRSPSQEPEKTSPVLEPTTSDDPFKNRKELVEAIQSELNRHQCNAGSVDGSWGRNSTLAVARFAKYAKLALPNEPSNELFNQIKNQRGKICPLSCGRRYETKNNKCVLKSCTDQKSLTKSGECVNTASGYDGYYKVAATRTVNGKLACLPTYNMNLTVTNGLSKHKIIFGPWLHAKVKNGTLHMSSKPSSSGGRWVGTFRLSNQPGKLTSGVFKWAGDNQRCVFKVSIVKK